MAAGPPPDPYRPCVILSIASPSPKADPGPNRGGAETMWGRISFLLTAAAVGFGVAGCQAVPVMPPSAADVPPAGDRQSVVLGTRVAVRVYLGGRGTIKKNNTSSKYTSTKTFLRKNTH